MEIKFLIFFILMSLVIYGIDARRRSGRPEWINNLGGSISRNFKQHQAVIVLGSVDSEWSTITSEIIQEISRRIPTHTFTYEKISRLDSFSNPDGDTLYIPIITSQLLGVVQQFYFLGYDFYYPKPRPKYLMINLRKAEDPSLKPFLEHLWKYEKLLDVTLIQLMRSREDTVNPFLDQEEVDAHVILFNPFNREFTEHELTSDSILFPDKTGNLYNSEFKVLSHPQSQNYKVLGEILAESMKFKLVEVTYRADKNIFVQTMEGDVEFILFETFLMIIQRRRWDYRYTKLRDSQTLHVVVPVMQSNDSSIVISWEFVWTIFATVLGICFIRILAKVLKFEDQFWRLMYIIQMILGVSSPDEPRRLAERIVFATIMLTWVIYSGYIHTALTTIDMYEQPDLINDLEDVIEYGLIVMMDPAMKRDAKTQPDTYLGRLSQQPGEFSEYDINNCLYFSNKYKNFTCLAYRMDLKSIMEIYPGMKVMKEPVMTVSWLHIVRDVSPFRDRINQVLSRVDEAGLTAKIRGYDAYNFDITHYYFEKSKNQLDLLQILVCVLVFGYSLSIIVFIAEMVIEWLKRRTGVLNVGRNRRA